MGSQRPLTSASRALSRRDAPTDCPANDTLWLARSIATSASGSASTAAAILAMSARLAQRHGMPSVVEFPKKISANPSAMTALIPCF